MVPDSVLNFHYNQGIHFIYLFASYIVTCFRIGLIFGVITCAAGFIGVGLGTFVASKLRNITKAADPLVCAFGLLASAPFLYGAVVLSRYKEVVVWVGIQMNLLL